MACGQYVHLYSSNLNRQRSRICIMYPYTVEDSAGTGKVFFQVQIFIFIQYLTLMYLVSIETIYFGHLLSKPYSKKSLVST